MLSDDQKAFYQSEGYLVLEDLIDGKTLAALRDAVAQMVAQGTALSVSDGCFDIGPDLGPGVSRLRRVKHPEAHHPAFEAMRRYPPLLDALEGLLGGGLRFDHGKLNFKPVGGGASIEWHQDWAFYPHSNDDLLAVGVMIEDCDLENGPMMVVPGSHRGPVFDHHNGPDAFVGAADTDQIRDLLPQAVPLVGKAGSVSIHHVRLLHGSRENRSARPRPLLLFSYSALDAFPIFKQPDLAEYDSRILRGAPTRAIRLEAVPARIGEPRATNAQSIFENQAGAKEHLLAGE